MRVIKPARAAGDLHTAAAAYNNLGRAASDAGDLSAAVDALQQARAIFASRRCRPRLRVRAGVSASPIHRVALRMAMPTLRDVRQELSRLGMPEEAGLAGVDLIEASWPRIIERGAELAIAIVEEFARLN